MAKSPPSETNGAENMGHVAPSAQNATSTAPSQILVPVIAATDDSEATKIVSSAPGC